MPIVLERKFWPAIICKFMFFNKLSHNSIKNIIGKYLFDYSDNIIDKLFLYRKKDNLLDPIECYKYTSIKEIINSKRKYSRKRKYGISIGLNLYFDLYGYNKIDDFQIKKILTAECNYYHMHKIIDGLSLEKKEQLAYWVIINHPHQINLFKGLDPMKLYEYNGAYLTLFEIVHKLNVEYTIRYLLFYSGVNKSPRGQRYQYLYNYIPVA